MKIVQKFGILIPVLLFLFSACQKEPLIETPTNDQAEARLLGGKEGTATDDDTPSYTDIEVVDGTLSFEDWEEFYQILSQLINDVDAHSEAFFAENPGLTEEEIDAMGFNEKQPLIDFEALLNFTSGIGRHEAVIEDWMNSTLFSAANAPQFVKYTDLMTATLLTPGAKVIIGENLIHFPSYMEENSRITSNCRSFNFEGTRTLNYASGNRRILALGYYWNIPFFVRNYTAVASYRRTNRGDWRPTRTWLGTGATGQIRTNGCGNAAPLTVSKDKQNRSFLVLNKYSQQDLWTAIRRNEFFALGTDLNNNQAQLSIPHAWP